MHSSAPNLRRSVPLGAALLLTAALASPLAAQQVVQGAPGETIRTAGGMVVSEHPEASRAGAEVLAAGGNAVDAAIATGFALAVTHPSAGNIGGGGFMVIRFPDGATTALDFREKAPARAHPEMFVGADGEYSSEIHHRSHLAVGVPGTVAGFDKAHRLYGSMNWERLVYPSVVLAEDGFVLSERLAGSIARFVERTPYEATIQAYSRDGVPYAAGDTLRQWDLAGSMRRIMLNRSAGFYEGETARLIAEEMRRGGGIIDEGDLLAYRARERAPIQGEYRGYQVISMPPPSSGGVAMVEMLEILEGYDIEALGHNTSRSVHLMAEAMRRAYRDRAVYLADPDYVDVPVHRLTSEEHAATRRATIDRTRASVSTPADVEMGYESLETTHYSVVDADGLAVSVTYTLEAGYGSGIVVPGAGFLLNNEMGDFNGRPGLTNESGLIGTEPNLARPGQRMLSSMTPTILAQGDRLVAVIGSPGGRTIINTVLQLVLNIVDHRMGFPEAVEAGRIHHQWLPDRIRAEEGALSGSTVQALENMGHTLSVGGSQGLAHSILVDPLTGDRVGTPDARNPDAGAAGHR
ncbi:gamma-glutamyltransferase [Gaopeijia maritima]|uniref:Glutathione hydrolase proenzyme n=1 Tax=Gaopeijia maritima TaxID=3119007 RepID=A0ABU9EE24_9BACT